jgi:hypothetical protein
MNADFSAVQLIQNEFPALVYHQQTGSGVRDVFKMVQNLANYTREQLKERNENEIEHCFKVAHEILVNGSNIAKLAIENVFVYSVSRLLEVSLQVSAMERRLFLKFFRKEYEARIGNNFP